MRDASRTTRGITLVVLAAAAALILDLPCAWGAQAPTAEPRVEALDLPQTVAVEGAADPSPIQAAPALPLSAPAVKPAPGDPLDVPPVPLGAPLKISAPMVLNGDVLAVLVNSLGTTAVYAADQDVDAVIELYSVAVTGGPVTQLNPPLVAGGNIQTLAIAANGTIVIYKADQDTDTIDELYSVPIGGGAATKLNGPLVAGGDVLLFGISPDSTRVVYIADQDADTVNELYSVPIGGGAVTKLNSALVLNGDVATAGSTIVITPDSSRVLYRADQVTDTVDELFSVPIGGGGVTKLNPTPVLNGDVAAFATVGGRTFYFADQDTDAVTELYSVPDSGGAVVKLNGALVAGGNVTNAFIGLTRVAYLADQDVNDVFEVYSVPSIGGAQIKLNPPLVAGGDVLQITVPDNDQTVLYRADQDADEVVEFYSVPETGGASTKLNGPLVLNGDVLAIAAVAVPPLPARGLYLGDQDTDNVIEVYGVPLPSGAQTKLNAPLVAGGNLTSVSFSASGLLMYRADQDADEVFEIHSRTTTGVGPVAKLNGPLVAGGDVQTDFRFSGLFPLPTSVVYRADQDADEVFELYSVFLDGDADADAVADGLDCLAYDSTVWALPGEVTALLLSHTGGVGGTTTLSWTAPGNLGGTAVVYDTIRSTTPSDFVTAATCVETNDGSDTSATDATTPATGQLFSYLVRAEHTCGSGPLGNNSANVPRTARACP